MLLSPRSGAASSLKVLSAALVAILIWALAPALMKGQDPLIPLSYFLFLRYLLGAIVFLPTLKNLWTQIRQIPFRHVAGFALFLALNHALQLVAIRELPVSWYVVLFSLSPVIALVLLKVKLGWQRLGWVAATFGGSLIFVMAEGFRTVSYVGLFSLLASAACWALITVYTKKIQTQLKDFEIAGLGHFLSLAVFAALWIFQGASTYHISAWGYGSLFLLGAGLGLAFLLFSFALRHRPEVAVISQYLEPVFGVVAGVLFFQESLQWTQVAGGLLIVIASIQASRPRPPCERPVQASA